MGNSLNTKGWRVQYRRKNMFAFNTVEELFMNSLLSSCQGQPCTAQGCKITSCMELRLWITLAQPTVLLISRVPVALSLCLWSEMWMIIWGKQSLNVWSRQMTQRWLCNVKKKKKRILTGNPGKAQKKSPKKETATAVVPDKLGEYLGLAVSVCGGCKEIYFGRLESGAGGDGVHTWPLTQPREEILSQKD